MAFAHAASGGGVSQGSPSILTVPQSAAESTVDARSASTISGFIAAGRCVVQQGDVSELRLPGESFDLATAFETVYFWPGIENCFAQVAKILKPGACFLICNEADGIDAGTLRFEKIIDGMKVYTAEDLEAALRKAGFTEVNHDHHASKPWITVLARK